MEFRHYGLKRGVTLIELMVAIAIIAILALFLVLGFNKVNQFSHKAVCASNLRTIGQGILLYAEDHNGHYPFHLGPNPARPPWGTPYLIWYGFIMPYIGEWGGEEPWLQPVSKIFHCPASPYPWSPEYDYRSVSSPMNTMQSYGYNFLFTTNWGVLENKQNPPDRFIPMQRVQHLDRFVLVAEQSVGENLPALLPVQLYPGTAIRNLSRRHEGYSHLLFADGRVALEKPEDILPGGPRYTLSNWNPNH